MYVVAQVLLRDTGRDESRRHELQYDVAKQKQQQKASMPTTLIMLKKMKMQLMSFDPSNSSESM
jgi:hypothetical protein